MFLFAIIVFNSFEYVQTAESNTNPSIPFLWERNNTNGRSVEHDRARFTLRVRITERSVGPQ